MFLEKHRIIIMRVGGQYVYGVCSYVYTFVCIKKNQNSKRMHGHMHKVHTLIIHTT